MSDDNNEEKLLDKELGRRGFLGILGGVAAAAAIPLSWNIAEAQTEVTHTEGPRGVDISEYIEPGTWEVTTEGSVDGYWEDIKNLEGAFTGKFAAKPTIQISKYLEHPDPLWRTTIGPVLIGRYDLTAYNMDVYADVIENTQFGEENRSYFTRGLKEVEVRCTFYGEEHLVETLYWGKRKLQVLIDLGVQSLIAFRFDAFAHAAHTLPDFVEQYQGGPLLGEVTFTPVGNIERLVKQRITDA
jgi:hypothetical protein